MMKNTIFLYCW